MSQKKLELEPEKYILFQLAEILGMMVCEIEESMPPDELVYWVAYFDIKNAKMKQEADKMKREAQTKSKWNR